MFLRCRASVDEPLQDSSVNTTIRCSPVMLMLMRAAGVKKSFARGQVCSGKARVHPQPRRGMSLCRALSLLYAIRLLSPRDDDAAATRRAYAQTKISPMPLMMQHLSFYACRQEEICAGDALMPDTLFVDVTRRCYRRLDIAAGLVNPTQISMPRHAAIPFSLILADAPRHMLRYAAAAGFTLLAQI